jgi:signal transduction histidine kinase
MSTNEQLPNSVAERNPLEAASLLWLKVLVTTRWTAILVVIIASLVATRIFHISFATLPVYIICGFMVVYNLVLLRQARSLEAEETGRLIIKIRTYGSIHIVLDLLTLTALLHFTGGIENPFIFYFVIHMIGASIALPQRVVYSLAGSAVLMVTTLVGLEYFEVIPHVTLVGFAPPTLYQQGSYILAMLIVLTTTLFISTYMATSVSMVLRKRQQQVVELRERLLEHRTGQLEMASREIAKLEEEKASFLRFLGIAAHDLKAPLTAIQGYFWVMLGGLAGKLTKKQRNMLERSSVRIKELLDLISDLLDIPRLETGQIVQEMKAVSLSEIIESCCDAVSKPAEEKGIELRRELPQSLPEIRGAGPRLQQVMANLLDNAIRYTPKGTVTVVVREQGKEIQVEVMDEGIGIPSEDLPKIFSDFFRGSNIEVKGTGLGLSIARRIVEAHGGRIWAESPCPETNKGCKFTFTLPKKVKKRG